jgi:flagellar motor switch protein FliM
MNKKPVKEIEVDFNSIMVRKTEVLSQDEIDQLLTAINAGDSEPPDYMPTVKGAKRKTKKHFEFKELEKLSIEAAQETSDNLSIMQKEFHSSLRDMKDIVDTLNQEIEALKKENETFRKQLRGASLFD